MHVLLFKYVTFTIVTDSYNCPLLHAHSSLHVIIPLTQDGATPLFVASRQGHSGVVNILIRSGANVNLSRNVWRPYTHTV